MKNDMAEDDNAEEQGIEGDHMLKIKKRYEKQTELEEELFTRFNEKKEDKKWRKKLMHNHAKSNHLNAEMDEVNLIREIFQENQS